MPVKKKKYYIALVLSSSPDPQIKYQQPPNGQLVAESNVPNVDPVAQLATCRRSAEAASVAAQQSFQQIQQMVGAATLGLPSFF